MLSRIAEHKTKIIIAVLVLVCVIVAGISFFPGTKKEDDPLDLPSSTEANGEVLSKRAEKAYNSILSNQFDDKEQALSAVIYQGKTVKGDECEDIVMIPDSDKGVYDFEKSPARRTLEKEFNIHYTGNVKDDIGAVLDLYTDSTDAGIDGLYNYEYLTKMAYAKVKGISLKNGTLTIHFSTDDIQNKDSKRNDRMKTEEKTESAYNPSSAAYAFCEYCLDYILLFPEYTKDIDVIKIKGKGFAPMHCSKENMTCFYGAAGGNLYQEWKGALDEAE